MSSAAERPGVLKAKRGKVGQCSFGNKMALIILMRIISLERWRRSSGANAEVGAVSTDILSEPGCGWLVRGRG